MGFGGMEKLTGQVSNTVTVLGANTEDARFLKLIGFRKQRHIVAVDRYQVS